MSSAESRLISLGIDLGTPAAPVANFVPTVVSDKLLFVSGQICFSAGKVAYTGQVGKVHARRRQSGGTLVRNQHSRARACRGWVAR